MTVLLKEGVMFLTADIECPDCGESLVNTVNGDGKLQDIQIVFCPHCNSDYIIEDISVTLATPRIEAGQMLLNMEGHG